jgi:putative sigma-54 modulation protein
LNITVNARHMEMSESLRAYSVDKAQKLQRYFDRIGSIEIIIDTEGGSPVVEVVVSASHNNTFVGRHRGEDMYGCIDNAIHKVEEQLRRHKERLRDHKGPSAEGQPRKV